MTNETPKTTHTILRVLIIAGVLVMLVFLSIGIVKIVPSALSSLASATVSIGSIFDNTKNASSTGLYMNGNATTTTNGNGFVTVDRNTSTTSNQNSNKTGASINYVPTPAKTYTQTNTQTNYSNNYNQNTSPADLSVSILTKGIIDPSTGNFIETNNFTTSDKVVVKFRIDNIGGRASGLWNLKVTMPSQNSSDQVKLINNQTSLPAGSSVTGQAIFDNPTQGNPNVTINVTSSNTESNYSDNTASVALNVIYNSNYNNNYNNGYNNNYCYTNNNYNNRYNNNCNTNYNNNSNLPDLTVRITDVGVMNNYNQFVSSNNIHTYDKPAVKFDVTNIGNQTTGAWYFRSQLGGYGKYYNSDQQPGIAPGQTVSYTIGFDNPNYGSNYIIVNVDSQNNIYESNENNNSATVNFNVN